ncbi:MAG: helix-turn-helix domain-containing protein [Ruminococcaceae bacterium]|nr:helix-turn-helix domain-containing protein [Oscillospiraceae bacterium]
METYIDRIKQIKNQKKITNDRLSEMTEIPLGTLSKILAGISDSPKLANIVSICEALGCSVDYILTGIPENTNNYTLDTYEMDLVEDYRKLDDHGRELISMVISKELERCAENVESPRFDARIVAGRGMTKTSIRKNTIKQAMGISRRSIELYDMPVSAGTGMFLADSQITTINIPSNPETESADFALRIKGNSMEPKYRDGDVLLVEECDSVEYGELGIFILDGESYFKQYGGDRLISLNPEYSDILLKGFDDISCCGKVIGKLKRK